ncbi:MAG: UPF0236 family protein [Peptococcaceae bacterium MAG4]|nr:UPF0236 family protein [Peptococcaceae bacterium MAG4]
MKRSIRALRNDILSDPEVVRDYRARLRENGYNISGLRGMGAAESNMDRFANRVKKRGQSWRRYGLQAIISALGKYYEGLLKPYAQQVARLKEKVNALADTAKVSVELAEQVLNNVYHPKQGGFAGQENGAWQFIWLKSILCATESARDSTELTKKETKLLERVP